MDIFAKASNESGPKANNKQGNNHLRRNTAMETKENRPFRMPVGVDGANLDAVLARVFIGWQPCAQLNRQQGELGTTHKIILQTAASIGSSLFRRVGADRVYGDVGLSIGHFGGKMGSDSGVRIGEGDEDSTAGEGESILR